MRRTIITLLMTVVTGSWLAASATQIYGQDLPSVKPGPETVPPAALQTADPSSAILPGRGAEVVLVAERGREERGERGRVRLELRKPWEHEFWEVPFRLYPVYPDYYDRYYNNYYPPYPTAPPGYGIGPYNYPYYPWVGYGTYPWSPYSPPAAPTTPVSPYRSQPGQPETPQGQGTPPPPSAVQFGTVRGRVISISPFIQNEDQLVLTVQPDNTQNPQNLLVHNRTSELYQRVRSLAPGDEVSVIFFVQPGMTPWIQEIHKIQPEEKPVAPK